MIFCALVLRAYSPCLYVGLCAYKLKVIDGPIITSRTPADLTPFVHAIIDAIMLAN